MSNLSREQKEEMKEQKREERSWIEFIERLKLKNALISETVINKDPNPGQQKELDLS